MYVYSVPEIIISVMHIVSCSFQKIIHSVFYASNDSISPTLSYNYNNYGGSTYPIPYADQFYTHYTVYTNAIAHKAMSLQIPNFIML